MSRFRSVYSGLTMVKIEAFFSSIKPTRQIGEKDELDFDHGPSRFAGLFGRAGDELPDASVRDRRCFVFWAFDFGGLAACRFRPVAG
jgi:hypothetical protein